MELKQALEIVIEDLDTEMVETPTQELANASNFLQTRLDQLKKEGVSS